MPLVYGVCLKYLKDPEASKDTTSQLFEKLIIELNKHEVSNFKSWLHVMTRNNCLMQLRTAKSNGITEKISDLDMEYTLPMHHTEEPTTEDQYQRLDLCLERLSKEQRLCVDEFFYKDKSYAQIVSSSGYDLKKVKSYIQNGKRNLKMCIENGK